MSTESLQQPFCIIKIVRNTFTREEKREVGFNYEPSHANEASYSTTVSENHLSFNLNHLVIQVQSIARIEKEAVVQRLMRAFEQSSAVFGMQYANINVSSVLRHVKSSMH